MQRTRGLRLGTIGGVPLTLTAGWALIALAMTFVFTPVVQSRLGMGLGPAVLVAFAVPVLLALSVLIHEIAHGVTAQLRGFRVREYVITLWGGHTTFMSEIDRPGAAAAVAAAGPAANLGLAALGWLAVPQLGPVGAFLTLTLTLTNAFVAVFNLLPASPLDGGKLLEAVIWRVTGDRWLGMRIAGRLGQVTAIAVMIGFVAWPYYTRSQGTFTVITGLIVALVIWQGAQQTVKAARVRARVEGFALAPYLRPAGVVDENAPVSDVVATPTIVTSGHNRNISLIDPHALAAVPPHARGLTPVSAVAQSIPFCLVRTVEGPTAVSEIAAGMSAGAKLYVHSATGRLEPGAVSVIDIDGVLAELKRRGA